MEEIWQKVEEYRVENYPPPETETKTLKFYGPCNQTFQIDVSAPDSLAAKPWRYYRGSDYTRPNLDTPSHDTLVLLPFGLLFEVLIWKMVRWFWRSWFARTIRPVVWKTLKWILTAFVADFFYGLVRN
jgi:hypothetical protein